MKKKLLFVNQWQYGYHIDYVQYCRYLKNDFDITYLCWDYETKKIGESGINLIYISRKGNVISRNIRIVRNVINYAKQNFFDLIFIHYFRGCSLISLFCKKEQKIGQYQLIVKNLM